MKTQTLDEVRIDLAAILRWADLQGLGEGVCNHFSVVVPGTTDRFLINPQGIHWSELIASDLVMVDPDGNLIEGKHEIEPTAFFIHSRIHRAKPEAKCVLHTHMPYATALACSEPGRLEFCSQNSLRYYSRVGYDDEYNGLALDDAEGDRLCAALESNDILFCANHGVIVTGGDIALAFDDLYYLERACMIQVLAMSTGQPLKVISDEVCRVTFEQLQSEQQQSYHLLAAIKRMLLERCPEFAN